MKDKTLAQTKAANIENTVGKNNIRSNISRQFEQALHHLEQKGQSSSVVDIATLAAKEWFTENLIMNDIRNSLVLQNPPTLHFISAEKDKTVACDSYINMPPKNASVLYGSFSDIFRLPYRTARAGWSCLDETKTSKTTEKQYALIWGDYCAFASTQLLEDFVHVVTHNMHKGIIYLTFCLGTQHNRHKKSMKDLSKYSKAKDIQDRTIEAVDYFANKIKGKTVHKVLEIVYGGGKRSGTTMLTVGFSVGLPKSAITPLMSDDSDWKSTETKKHRQAVVFNKLVRVNGWKLRHVGRPSKNSQKSYKSSKQSAKIDKAVKHLEKTWKGLDDLHKDAIVSALGISRGSMGSRLAHYHGKFGEKKKA